MKSVSLAGWGREKVRRDLKREAERRAYSNRMSRVLEQVYLYNRTGHLHTITYTHVNLSTIHACYMYIHVLYMHIHNKA